MTDNMHDVYAEPVFRSEIIKVARLPPDEFDIAVKQLPPVYAAKAVQMRGILGLTRGYYDDGLKGFSALDSNATEQEKDLARRIIKNRIDIKKMRKEIFNKYKDSYGNTVGAWSENDATMLLPLIRKIMPNKIFTPIYVQSMIKDHLSDIKYIRLVIIFQKDR